MYIQTMCEFFWMITAILFVVVKRINYNVYVNIVDSIVVNYIVSTTVS